MKAREATIPKARPTKARPTKALSPAASLLPRGLPIGWRGAGVVLSLVLLASALLELRHVQEGPVLCPVRAATGVPCPGCGLSRSFVATAHVEVGEAWALNPFGPVLFLAGALALLAILLRAASGRWPLPASAVPWIRRGAGVTVAIWLVWAAARIAPHLT